MATSKLQIIVETNTRQLDQLQSKVKQSEGNLSKLQGKGKQVSQSFNQIGASANKAANGISKTGRSAEQASGGFKSLGKAFRSLLAAYSLFEAVKFTIGSTAELETQRKSLEVLTGSVEEANRVIKELQDFGAVTPFTSTELIDTAKRLKAFGVDTDKLVETTKRLGDVSGATGAKLEGVATAYGQIQAKGRLQGEELLQLQERGINLQDELQKMYGLTGEEFRKALEKGRFSAEAVEVALTRLTDAGGKYANGAIAQSETLAGKFSTLVDGITRIAQTIGNVLSPALKQILGEAIGVINSINAALAAGARAQQFGITADQRNKLFRQAGEEAEQLAKLRGGGRIDPAEFTRLRDQRFKDLIETVGYETGQIQVEIEPVLANGAQTIPELLGGASSSGGGRSGGGRRSAARSKIDDTAEKQARAYASIRQSLERTILLESELTQTGLRNSELQREKLRNAFDYEDTVKRIRTEVNAAQQEELVGFAKLKQEQADFNALKESASDFPGFFKDAAKIDSLLDTSQELESVWGEIGTEISNTFLDLIQGTTSWNDALQDTLKSLSSILFQAAIKGLAGGDGQGIFSFFAGGFADGGTIPSGQFGLVGENGPEFISGPANITPMGEAGNTIVNITINNEGNGSRSSSGSDAQEAARLGKLVERATLAVINREKRPGGTLRS